MAVSIYAEVGVQIFVQVLLFAVLYVRKDNYVFSMKHETFSCSSDWAKLVFGSNNERGMGKIS